MKGLVACNKQAEPEKDNDEVKDMDRHERTHRVDRYGVRGLFCPRLLTKRQNEEATPVSRKANRGFCFCRVSSVGRAVDL